MFEELFLSPRHLARYNNAPHAFERARYLRHLKEAAYSEQTLLWSARALMRVVRWLHIDINTPVTARQIEAAADQYAQKLRSRTGSCRRRFIQAATAWLRFSGRLQAPRQERVPFAELIEDFAAWMRDERGLAVGTIDRRSRFVGAFLRWYHPRKRSFHHVRITDVDDYLVHLAGRWSRRSMATQASDLRMFFRHAGKRGWCSPAIADAIQGPRVYARELLPLGPAWDQVEELMASIGKRQTKDFRDRATFMLLAIYGLRASEVAAMRLEDLDWDHDQIRIRRPKCRDSKVCPLVPTVGNAIVEYLKKGRPESARSEVFLTLNAPFHPMSPGAIGMAVRRRMGKLKIPPDRRGSHGLRHACATHLLGEGFSIKEIGDHLGQISPASAQVYAKVDLAGLRTVGNFDIGGLL